MSELTEAELVAETNDGQGPPKSAGFNQMAAALDAALKGKPIDAKPAPSPEGQAKPVVPKDEPEPAKAVEPAKEADPDEDINPENPMFLPQRKDWARMRESLKEAKKEAKAKAEIEAKLKQAMDEINALKTKPVTPPAEQKPIAPPETETIKAELERIKAEREQYEKELKMVALERSPEFKNHFEAKFKAATDTAISTVGAEKQDAVKHALTMPPSATRKNMLAEIMADMDDVDKTTLAAAVVEMDRARAERAQALADNESNYKRLQEIESQKQARSRQMQEQQVSQAVNNIIEVARRDYRSFQKTDSEEHNSIVAQAEARVKAFFSGQMAPEEIAMLPVIRSEFELLKREHAKVVEESEKLRKTVAEYESASPKVEGGATPKPAKKGFVDRYMEAVRQA